MVILQVIGWIAIPIIVAATATVSTIFIYKHRKYEGNRPRLSFIKFELPLDKLHIHAGEDITWAQDACGTNLISQEHVDKYLNSSRLKKDTKLNAKNKQYLFINNCDAHTNYSTVDDAKMVVIAFDVLTMGISFDKPVRKVRIKDAFTWAKGERLGEDMEYDVEFSVRKKSATLELPVAYAFQDGLPISLNVRNIYDKKKEQIKKSGKAEPINVGDLDDVRNYITFTKTAYLIECDTINSGSKPYMYTLFLEVDDDGLLIQEDPVDGSRHFYKSLKKMRATKGQRW